MSKKFSQFTSQNTVSDNDYINITGATNRRIVWPDFLDNIYDRIVTPFIYPTIVSLQEAPLRADEDNPVYVRVEETEYRLYKITNIAPGASDIVLNNGNTATAQTEYRDIGFVVGPETSTIGALATYDNETGTLLAEGPTPSTVGVNFIEFPDSASDGYFRKKNDNTLELLNGDQLKVNLSLDNVDNTSDADKPISTATQTALNLKAPLASPALTGNPTAPTQPAGTSDTTLANTAYVQGELTDRIQSVATIADLRALTGLSDGQQIELLGHTLKGVGGGTFYVDAGLSVSDNEWRFVEMTDGTIAARKDTSIFCPQYFGSPVDGSDATAAFQAAASVCDAEDLRVYTIPNLYEEYLIADTIQFAVPGVAIRGSQCSTYLRTGGKDIGWLNGADGLVRFFDLGASRTTGNAADTWRVDGISMRQAAGVPVRTIDGIAFTSRTDGPDRGAKIENCSFKGLNDGITIENPDVSITLATLEVNACTFVSCDSAINAKGRLFGLRFVGNQCEQNFGPSGVLRGYLDGPITIMDNMLEGQPNVLTIDEPPTYGNSFNLIFKHNYLELNSGDYVVRLDTTTSRSTAEIGPNYVLNITATDYVLVQNSAGALMLKMYDEFPVTFDNSPVTLKYGSELFNRRQRFYKLRRISTTKPSEIILSEFEGLMDYAADHTHALPPAGTTAMTPFGVRNVWTGTSFRTVGLACSAGDLISVNVMMLATESVVGSYRIQIYDNAETTILAEWSGSGIATELGSKWALVNFCVLVAAASTTLKIRFLPASGTYTTTVAGIAAKNHGAHANDGSATKSIVPVLPNIV